MSDAPVEPGLEEVKLYFDFGVPLFLFRGEPFWGHDRIALLEECLGEAGH